MKPSFMQGVETTQHLARHGGVTPIDGRAILIAMSRVVFALVAIAGVASCAGYIEQQRRQEAEIKAADAALDRDRITVQTGDLALPYEQLGSLEYAEPFSADANDEKHIDEKLRTMAIVRWGNQVDALLWLTSSLSADASQLRVSATAVRVKGDCSFCRHQGGYPQGQ